MEIASLTETDWEVFLRLAGAEGWRIPQQELELLRGSPAGGAFALRFEDEPRGFVSAVAHQHTGWIGNLIVPAACRGRGYGSRLFAHALEVLAERGVRSIWLTASAMGRPLYEKMGFRAVDGIGRWSLRVPGRTDSPALETSDVEMLLEKDALVWGESRRDMLLCLARKGQIFSHGGTAAVLQKSGFFQVLGPWVSQGFCPRENRQLLMAVLAAADQGTELVVDLLESSPAAALLAAAGFTPGGRCDLMVRGDDRGIDLGCLVALASLGSMG